MQTDGQTAGHTPHSIARQKSNKVSKAVTSQLAKCTCCLQFDQITKSRFIRSLLSRVSTAMLTQDIDVEYCPSVRPSVRHVLVLYLNSLSSYFLHRKVANHSTFIDIKHLAVIPTSVPPNIRGVYKSCNFLSNRSRSGQRCRNQGCHKCFLS